MNPIAPRFALLACVTLAFSIGCGGQVSTSDPDPAPVPAGGGPGTNDPGSPSDPSAPSGPQGVAGIVGEYGYELPPGPYKTATAHAAANAATYEFDCMQGNSGPIVPDATGAFSTKGSLTSVGGPTTTYGDVTFSGTVIGDTLTLTVAWPSTETTSTGTKQVTDTYGPVTLTKGLVPTLWPGCI